MPKNGPEISDYYRLDHEPYIKFFWTAEPTKKMLSFWIASNAAVMTPAKFWFQNFIFWDTQTRDLRNSFEGENCGKEKCKPNKKNSFAILRWWKRIGIYKIQNVQGENEKIKVNICVKWLFTEKS